MNPMIVDTHQHLWDLERVAYPWLTPDFGPIARTCTAAELEPQLAPAGVSRTVLVQSANSYADTEYMFEQAAIYPWMAGVVGWVPLLYPDVAGRMLERFAANLLFRGIRHLIHNEADPRWLLQERVIEGLGLLAARGLTFDVVATLPEHMACIPVLGERVPGLKMVIDHLGQPPISTRALGRWGEDIRVAAENPNVYAKISGLGTASGMPETWAAGDVRPYIDHVLEVFGPQRCMFGGDWPVSILAGGYVKAWTVYREIAAGWPTDVQVQVCNGTAQAFYGLSL
ncbi:MAG: Amidohydrolase [Chloroflexi bacterium ADurb.Bin325]|nr:MAG: Amidohydrolase [Chloroflexi bacterium ADurb.Bin325]